MAIRRRIFKKRRISRKRTMNITRGPGYKLSQNRIRRTITGATLKVKRTVYAGLLSPSAALSTGTSYFWQYVQPSLDRAMAQFDATGTALGSLTNLAEYQALFDQYRLGAIKYTFRPRMVDLNSAQADTVTLNGARYPPQWIIVKDPRSTLTPSGTYSQANINTLLEHGGKVLRADKVQSVYLKPEVTEQYGSGAIRYVKPRFTDLNTAAGTDMKHRGFHLLIYRNGMNTTNTDLAWDVYVTYYLTFKNPK